jgi:hypothetical protein
MYCYTVLATAAPADSSGCSHIRTVGEGLGYSSWPLLVYYTPFRSLSAPMHLVS